MKVKTIYRYPLGNPERKYRQDRFLVGTCKAWGAGEAHERDDMRRCIKACKELGLDQVEFIWATPEMTKECMDACEEFEIDGIFQDFNSFGGFQSSIGRAEIDEPRFKEFMKNGEKRKNFGGYTVWDEPLSDESLENAARNLGQMEKLDKKRVLNICAIPSYNGKATWNNGLYEQYLEKYVNIINPPFLNLDYYPFSATRPEPSNQLDDNPLFLDIALLRKLGLEKQIPIWFCIQAQDSPFGEKYYRFTAERMYMQAYNVLLHGGKAVMLYNTVEGAVYNDGRKGPLYFQTKELVDKLHQLGKTMMALESVHAFHSPELLKGNQNFDKYRESVLQSQILDEETLPFRCSVGELEDAEGNRYLMILNRDYLNSKTFHLHLKNNYRVYQVSCENGMQRIRNDNTKSIHVVLKAGEATLLRFQNVKEEAFLIEYILRK